MKLCRGIGVSPGVSVAKAFVYRKKAADVEQTVSENAEKEKEKLQRAYDELIGRVTELSENGGDSAEIFDAHKMILEDPSLIEDIFGRIDSGKNAAWAADEAMSELAEFFAALDDEYMRARAADMEDLRAQLLSILTGACDSALEKLPGKVILVAEDLLPSDTMVMDTKNVAGIVCKNGSATSHVSIIAKNLSIPAIVACAEMPDCVENGMTVAINGASGEVFASPDEETAIKMAEEEEKFLHRRELLKKYKDIESVTSDGVSLAVEANIGGPQDIEAALNAGAKRVGLFRTEFLYMASPDRLPDEETQFEAYSKVAKAFEGPVIVRTLDIGGDKQLKSLPIEREGNPFLGYRAIRICLHRKDIFLTQIRAILRAGVFGKLKIMLPMITTVEELREAKTVIEQAREELSAEGKAFDTDMPVGIMVETPAAVMMADELAKESAFFSIGTNDLMQYTMCADRGNASIAYLYSVYRPPVLRMINNAISAAKKNGIPCGMCGEAASDRLIIPFLVGCGLDEFSVNIGAVPATKEKLCSVSAERSRALSKRLLGLETMEAVLSELRSF